MVKFSSYWVTHLACMGFDCIVPLQSSHCGFFVCRVSFLIGSNVFLLIVFQQLDVILMFP